MSGLLIISPEDEVIIKAAVDRARANVIPWAKIKDIAIGPEGPKNIMFKDRKGSKIPQKQHIRLGTYEAAISFEEQPSGIVRHLSVSSGRKGKVPGPEVMAMVAEAFGFSGFPPKQAHNIWAEEFVPGWMAINVAEVEP